MAEKKQDDNSHKQLDESFRKNNQQDRSSSVSNDWGKRSNDVTDTLAPPTNPNKTGDGDKSR